MLRIRSTSIMLIIGCSLAGLPLLGQSRAGSTTLELYARGSQLGLGHGRTLPSLLSLDDYFASDITIIRSEEQINNGWIHVGSRHSTSRTMTSLKSTGLCLCSSTTAKSAMYQCLRPVRSRTTLTRPTCSIKTRCRFLICTVISIIEPHNGK